MLHGRDIVCISSIDWDTIWQGHQEIMSRLAAAGNRILFVEFTGVRRPGLRDVPRLVRRFKNWRRGSAAYRSPLPNLTILSPLALPFPYARLALWANTALVGRSLARVMEQQAFRRPVAWVFLPTPLARRLIRIVNPSVTLYHCVDDLASSSPNAARIRESEEALLRDADLVFVTSERLRQRAARFNQAVHDFPSGVSFERFEAARLTDAPVPADIAALPRPIAGYIGGLHQWLDLDLLDRTARALPDVSFILVGPVRVNVGPLSRQRNVHVLGAKPREAIPYYIKSFSVGLIPYVRATYTDHVYPAKLNEYLAMGIPVVSTDLPEVRRFNRRHGDPVTIAADADALVAAVRDHVTGCEQSGKMEHRIAVARANGWTERLVGMSVEIEAAERRRGTARLDRAV